MEPARHVMAEHGFQAAHVSPIGGSEALWALLATSLAIATVVLTFRALVHRRYTAAADSVAPTGLGGILYNKWYVDELYDRIIVRPLIALWRACWQVVDVRLIDASVNGLAASGKMAGWAMSLLQTGRVATYLTVFVIGALLILGTFLL